MLTELDQRIDGGIEVTLLWNSGTGETLIEVSDLRLDSTIVFSVAADKAGDAFRHPFAYLHSAAGNSYPVAA
jgi:hypothetical protein